MIDLIILLINILTILILGHVLLTWIVSPYHPLREALDRIVEPMLAPIRRILPFAGGLDFSPLVLLLLVQLIGRLLIGLLIG
ncbi:MAG TPA: YggT family protein [Anaerolineales bacterium]|jgi:YggT family protein|nr:YggT family protein [Anaerolineales bacterium]